MKENKNHPFRLRLYTSMIGVCCLSMILWTPQAGADTTQTQVPQKSGQSADEERGQRQDHTLLPTHRIIKGTVEEVTEDHAKVDSGVTGEISPRYLSLERAREKGFTVKPGDKLEIVVNAKNHVVDYHLINGTIESDHRIIKGFLAQPLKVGQEHAIIKTQEGKTETFPVRPLARSEVAAIPFDTEAWFLLDETNKIASATLPHDIVAEYDWARSSAYNVYRHVSGVVQNISNEGTMTIRTTNGQTVSLPVWDYLQNDIAQLSKGMNVTLLVDDQEKIVDIAVLPKELE